MNNLLSVETIVLIALLFVYILSSHVIEIKNCKYLHESSIAIFAGLLVALIISLFDHDIFFTFLLPPIILAAGYNLPKKHFFENIGYISFFGIAGTLLTVFIIALFAFLLNSFCVLTSSDTVAALSLVKESAYPKLNSILFGEGIVNDAVSIVLFRTIKKFKNSIKDNNSFTFLSFGKLFLDFIYVFSLSLLIGIGLGLIITYLFKKTDSLKTDPVKEISLVVLSGYMSYMLAEFLNMSGIMAIFVCGLVMSHYASQNMSEISQNATKLAFDVMGYLCEALVFGYLGITIYFLKINQFHPIFIVGLLLSLFMARFFGIFLLPCLLHLLNFNIKLKIKELNIIWYSGLIRGSIAFALCLHLESDNKNLILATAVSIILITTLILSGLLKSFASCIGLEPSINSETEITLDSDDFLKDKETEKIYNYLDITQINKIITSKKAKNQKNEKKREEIKNSENFKSNFQKKWKAFDEKYIMPVFIRNHKNGNEKILPTNIDLAEFNKK